MEKNHIESAVDKFCDGGKINLVDFFTAWQIHPSIIADRLRRTGFNITSAEVQAIITSTEHTPKAAHLLRVILYELRNDINKTLYEK